MTPELKSAMGPLPDQFQDQIRDGLSKGNKVRLSITVEKEGAKTVTTYSTKVTIELLTATFVAAACSLPETQVNGGFDRCGLAERFAIGGWMDSFG